ncbi:hypothetical protein BDV10DRAFT_190086 [Aspergillus recurvatus]
MILQLLLYLIFLIPFPIIIIFVLFHKSFRPPVTKAIVFKTATEYYTIIEASQFPDSRKNQLTQYKARAWPNRSLRRAFGIQNAFTTGDVTLAKSFVSKAHRLIRASAVDWRSLSSILSNMVLDMNWALADDEMSISGGTQVKVILAPMVQALALRTSLSVLFKIREGVTIESKHLVDLGTIIHKTWMDMKSGNEEVIEFKDNSILIDQLSAVFAKYKVKINIQNLHTNPLNLILPSFETLWRIILRLFIVLYNREDYKQILLDFVQKPTPTQFKFELGEELISAEFLVKEAEAGASVLRRCKEGNSPLFDDRNGWRDWPETAKEKEVLDWLSKVISEIRELATEENFTTLCNCTVLAHPSQPLQGSTADRKLDVGIVCNPNARDSTQYHWSHVLVLGELKSSPSADTASTTWRDLGRYAREVLTAQDTRRFALGFTLCGPNMRLWEFDRVGAIASSPFDINKDGFRFISTMLGANCWDSRAD